MASFRRVINMDSEWDLPQSALVSGIPLDFPLVLLGWVQPPRALLALACHPRGGRRGLVTFAEEAGACHGSHWCTAVRR